MFLNVRQSLSLPFSWAECIIVYPTSFLYRFLMRSTLPLFFLTVPVPFDIISEFFNRHLICTARSFISTNPFISAFMLSLDSIFSNSSDIALCTFSFPFPWIRPILCRSCSSTFCLSSSTCLIYAHGLRLPFKLRCLMPAYLSSTSYTRFVLVRL